MTADEARAAYLDGLQKLVDRLRADDSIPLPWDGFTRELSMALKVTDESAELLAHVVASLGGTGWQQQTVRGDRTDYLYVNGHLDGLRVQVIAHADKVCEPVDPQPVIERRCPQHHAVIAEAQEGGEQ